MNARGKLNVAYLNGCLVLAAIAGAVVQSWPVFFVALTAAVVLNVIAGGIRMSGKHRQ